MRLVLRHLLSPERLESKLVPFFTQVAAYIGSSPISLRFPTMDEEAEVHYYYQYHPPGVTSVIASGMSTWIGEVDECTVLKYPLEPSGDMSRLEVERKLLEIIGPHERVIGLKGFSDTGLYLERAQNGHIANYLESANPPPTTKQRLMWCREAAEAVAWIHSRRILHCDIHPLNILLDDDLHVKLADFQGQHISENGEVLLDGGSAEPTRFCCPRDDIFHADVKTDIFALGCLIYFIMLSHQVYPDIIDGEEGWREKVEDRFRRQQWPLEQHLCSRITLKCWKKEYESAQEIVQDIKSLDNSANPVVQSLKSLLCFPIIAIRRMFRFPVLFKGWIWSIFNGSL